MRIALFRFFLPFFFFAGSLICAVSLEAASAGLLTNVQGKVTVISKGQDLVGRNGQAISDNDTIVTGIGASAMLTFNNGVSVKINADTSLMVEKYVQDLKPVRAPEGTQERGVSTTKLKLNFGEIVGKDRKLNPNSTFQVMTPVGIAGIRGTEFLIQIRKDSNGQWSARFGVLSGFVDVQITGAAAAALNSLGANQGLDIRVDISETGEVTVLSTTAGALDAQQLQILNEAIDAIVDPQVIKEIIINPYRDNPKDPTLQSGLPRN
jgi:hypothetical protein